MSVFAGSQISSVQVLPLSWERSSGLFRFVTLGGNTIETWSQSRRVPLIDGVPVYPGASSGSGAGVPPLNGDAYRSPYLKGGGKSGVVNISYPAIGTVSLTFGTGPDNSARGSLAK